MDKPLYISEFTTVDEAITFVKECWSGQDLDAIESMLEIDKELGENKNWLAIIGVCDICGVEEMTFAPACIYDDEITGIECPQCGNMSVYPKEQEDEL